MISGLTGVFAYLGNARQRLEHSSDQWMAQAAAGKGIAELRVLQRLKERRVFAARALNAAGVVLVQFGAQFLAIDIDRNQPVRRFHMPKLPAIAGRRFLHMGAHLMN